VVPRFEGMCQFSAVTNDTHSPSEIH